MKSEKLKTWTIEALMCCWGNVTNSYSPNLPIILKSGIVDWAFYFIELGTSKGLRNYALNLFGNLVLTVPAKDLFEFLDSRLDVVIGHLLSFDPDSITPSEIRRRIVILDELIGKQHQLEFDPNHSNETNRIKDAILQSPKLSNLEDAQNHRDRNSAQIVTEFVSRHFSTTDC